ncbi:hypothetical protein Droror1_Dr00024684 [Drosera rotundifolia]
MRGSPLGQENWGRNALINALSCVSSCKTIGCTDKILSPEEDEALELHRKDHNVHSSNPYPNSTSSAFSSTNKFFLQGQWKSPSRATKQENSQIGSHLRRFLPPNFVAILIEEEANCEFDLQYKVLVSRTGILIILR